MKKYNIIVICLSLKILLNNESPVECYANIWQGLVSKLSRDPRKTADASNINLLELDLQEAWRVNHNQQRNM